MYYQIQTNFISELHLKNNELLVYSLIHSLSQNGAGTCKLSIRQMANATGCDSLKTIHTSINSLIEKNLIYKNVVSNTYPIIIEYCTIEKSPDMPISPYLFNRFDSITKDKYFNGYKLEIKNNEILLSVKKFLPKDIFDTLQNQVENYNCQMGTFYRLNAIIEENKKENKFNAGDRNMNEYVSALIPDEELDNIKV